MTIKERYNVILNYFQTEQPEVETELKHSDSYELLVSVILSAQCTDKRVNLITPALFKAYPTVFDMASADASDIFEYIKSCSYPNSKAKYLAGMARMLVDNFKGVIPSDPIQLQKLPGVGRKTANVLTSIIFNAPTIAVDTHVFRVSKRIGLADNAFSILQTEKQLLKYIPENLRVRAHHWLLLHGRYVCKARKPLCEECGIAKMCRYYEANRKNSKD